MLYSTKVILNKTFRTLFFIIEKNGASEDERYQSQCILDVNPYPNGVPPPPVAPANNGKGAGKAEAKTPGKAAK